MNVLLPYTFLLIHFLRKTTRQIILPALFISISITTSANSLSTANKNVSPAYKNIANYETATRLLTDTTHTTICINQLPYSWNGLSILSAGVYTTTITASDGTDSLAVLKLTINNISTSVTYIIKCSTELPFIWNGQQYTTGGTYSITLTNNNGCDSVAILSLSVNDVVSSTTRVTVCENDLPFRWNGHSYPTPGDYTVTLTSVAHCDSIATLKLRTKPNGRSLTIENTCTNRLPFQWNGHEYTTPGTYNVILPGTNSCDSTATLELHIKPIATSITRDTVCSNRLPYIWNGREIYNSGAYRTVLTAANGCDSIPTLYIVVKQAASSNTAVTICDRAFPYSWNGLTLNTPGNYSVTLQAANGCDSVARLQLYEAGSIHTYYTQNICNSELPYNWNGQTITSNGNYTTSFITASGCDSIVHLTAIITTPTVISDSLRVCSESLPFNYHGIIINGSGNYPFSPPIQPDPCTSIVSLNFVVEDVIPGNVRIEICENNLPYRWNNRNYYSEGIYTVGLVSELGCDSMAILDLRVKRNTASQENISACSNAIPYVWNNQSLSAPGTYTAIIPNYNGCDSVITGYFTIIPVKRDTVTVGICPSQLPFDWNGQSFNAGGYYPFVFTSSNNCDSISVLHLIVAPIIHIEKNIGICDYNLPFRWNGTSYNTTGSYTQTFTNTAGCDSIVTINLTVYDQLNSTTVIYTWGNQLPFRWNGVDYYLEGTYTTTLTSVSGCDSIATLELHLPGTVSSVTYDTICPNALPYTWNGNSYSQAGSYAVIFPDNNGIDSVAVLNLTVTDILTSTTNITLCPSQLPYRWNGNNYFTEGTYAITLTTPQGCDSVPILSLTIAPASTSSTTATVCQQDLPYMWNGLTLMAAGTTSVTLINQNGCDSIASLNLIVTASDTSFNSLSVCSNQLPLIWNGHSISTSGIYYAQFNRPTQCDSIAVLTLSVFNPTSSTTTQTICNNQLPYSWNGNSYTSAGNYHVNLLTADGCDSTANLILNVLPTSASNTRVTVCTNQLPYRWNGNFYSQPGNYAITLLNQNGCDSIAQLSLSTNSPTQSLTTRSICSSELPFIWNGQQLIQSGNYALTFSGTNGCDSIARLNLTVQEADYTSMQMNICAGSLPYYWNGLTLHSPGRYTAYLTNQHRCDSIVTLDFFVSPQFNITTDRTVCRSALPIVWQNQTITQAGRYTDTLTSVSGCDSILILNVSIKEASSSLATVQICASDTPYIWGGHSFTASGTYTRHLINAGGCDSTATLELTIRPNPGAADVISPVNYCQGDPSTPLIATANNGSSLHWFSPGSNTGATNPPTPSTATPGTYIYYVEQNDGFCTGVRVPITVIVNNKPNLGEDKLQAVCYGQTANLTSFFAQPGLPIQWSFQGNSIPPPLVAATPGNYIAIATNSDGCSDTAIVQFEVRDEVFANAGRDTTIETNTSYRLHGSGNGSFSWTPATLVSAPNIANPFVRLQQDATLILTVANDLGCLARDTLKLRVINGPTFYVPNAFTPNGDGLNDIIRPTPVGIHKLDYFRIYNRFGELVFETANIGEGWNGIYKGKPQPIGNYVWYLKGTDRLGNLRSMKGNVILIR